MADSAPSTEESCRVLLDAPTDPCSVKIADAEKKDGGCRTWCKDLPWGVIRIAALAVLLLVLIVACIVAEAFRSTGDKHGGSDRQYHEHIVRSVNEQQRFWKARYNQYASRPQDYKFQGVNTKEQFQLNMAVAEALDADPDNREHMQRLLSFAQPLPERFDARQHWSLCWTIHNVPNQGGCGSCWAMSAAAVMTDRVCIHTNGTQQPQLSAEDLTSCCAVCGGCNGALLSTTAFWYWKEHGLVTGGAHGSYEGCKPYSIASDCGQPCNPSYYRSSLTAKCKQSCQKHYEKTYDEDKFYGSAAYSISPSPMDAYEVITGDVFRNIGGEEQRIKMLKAEIFTRGPVLACFPVFEDFQHYESGIYRHTAGERLYGHCAKVYGWDVENGTMFWRFTNTWGHNWGENGHFRMHEDHTPRELAAGMPRV